MHTPEVCKTTNGVKEEKDDGPSVLGRFMWTVVGNTCIPCLLKNDGTKYVSVRIAESKVLSHFLIRLNAEVFNCVSVKSFGISEAEMKLLNEINTKHCEFSFGREPFTMDTDFIVKLDDLIEFYEFMDTCYTKLTNQTPTNSKKKCGFVRINDDSVVPYAVKDDQKYVPLFYFEGETESLKTKAVNLENWDLAYLKFCCKVQGIKNELFASEQCSVTSLEDVKSYFPEGTKFDDYWPSKVVEMQTSNRNDLNSNHSWVQTPHIDSSIVPQSIGSNPNHAMKTVQSVLAKQLHNNQRTNTTAVINSISTPYVQPNTWQTSIVGNNMNSIQSGSYQLSPTVAQQRMVAKQTPVTMHSMNANNVASRVYSNQSVRAQNQYYNANTNNVPNVQTTTQQPPPLVKVPAPMSNVYSNSMSAPSYLPIYSAPVYSIPNTQSHHLNNNTANSQMTNKIRGNIPNQVTATTRYPPALTPIGTGIIQTNNPTVMGKNISTNNSLTINNRNKSNFSPSGDEIIDLSSPPHSPQDANTTSSNKTTAPGTAGCNYGKLNNTFQGNVIKIAEVTNMTNQSSYKIKLMNVKDKQVPALNLDLQDANKLSPNMAVTLYDLHKHFFSKMETKELKEALLNALKCDLYRGNTIQMQILRELHKNLSKEDDFLLIKLEDFSKFYKQISYVHNNNKHQNPLKQGGGDAKRQKIS